jgi:hypothetical protein
MTPLSLSYRDVHRALSQACGPLQGLPYLTVKTTLHRLGITGPIRAAHTVSVLASEGALRVYSSGFVHISPELPPKR